jgi:hypothetical protein
MYAGHNSEWRGSSGGKNGSLTIRTDQTTRRYSWSYASRVSAEQKMEIVLARMAPVTNISAVCSVTR